MLIPLALPRKCYLFNDGVTIQCKNNINVLGIIFDSKLNWDDQIADTIYKTNRALHCVRQIKTYFSPVELLQLIMLNPYSILYHNSEVWNTPTLHYRQKQLLLSTSANAFKYAPHLTMRECCSLTYIP